MISEFHSAGLGNLFHLSTVELVLDPNYGFVEWFAFSSKKFAFLIFNQLIC